MTPTEPTPPRAIGRYLLFGELAAGGMASVHLGRLVGPVGFSRTVAIKRLHPQLARDPEGVSAFLDEARLTARVQHPNVAQTLDVVEMPGELFLVMEYVRGETLSRLVRAATTRGERPPLRIVASIVTGALYGLHAAHEARNERGLPLGIVHRDVSPQNVIVGVDGVARVLDFGVAKAIGRVSSTSDGQIKGKISYMPPEQLSAGQVDRRTDVYAAAVVLWEALTARRLFEGDAQGVVIGRIIRGDIEPPSQHAPGLPPEVDAIVMRGLALDPDARYATALDMATALERLGGASPRDVGAWVEEMAGAVLGEREAMVAEVESASFSGISAEGLRRTAETTSAVASDGVDARRPAEPRSTGSAQSLSAFASSPSLPSAPTTDTPPISEKKRRPILLLAPIAAVVMLVAGVVAFRRSAPEDPRPAAAPPPATSAVVTSPTADDSAASAAPVSPPPPSTASASAKPALAPPRGTTRVPPPKAGGGRGDCNPPFRVDADGIRHMKPECF